MKIGIVTFHSGFNYGAFFQVYALQEAISSLGHDCWVINYKNFKHTYKEYQNAFYCLNPKILPSRFPRVLNFKRAQNKLNRTKRFFKASETHFNDFDAVFYGADEIWNLDNCLFGVDDVYFGDKSEGVKQISYAASFGSYTPDNEGLPTKYTQFLKKFDFISVRDKNSFNIIQEYVDSDAVIVPDPTFLHDFVSQRTPFHFSDEKYVAVYGAGLTEKFEKEIRDFAKKRNLKIFAFGYNKKYADRNFLTLNPFQLIDAIKNAEYVFTAMFHGTIFSILTNRQFCLELSPYRTNKFQPMLDELGLRDRAYDEQFEEKGVISIDYEQVNKKIEKFSQSGLRYLEKVLNK